MTGMNRTEFFSATGAAGFVLGIALGLSVAGEPALADQPNRATQVAAHPDTATLIAATDEDLLAERIERALRQADAVGAEGIQVTVTKGVVELNGTVETPAEVRAAQEIAYAQGALVVDNKLQIPAWDATIDRTDTGE